MTSSEPAHVDWAEFEKFVTLLGRGDSEQQLVISLFPDDRSKPNIHIPCLAGSIPKAEINSVLARRKGLSLGLVINPPLPKPADWGRNRSTATSTAICVAGALATITLLEPSGFGMRPMVAFLTMINSLPSGGLDCRNLT